MKDDNSLKLVANSGPLRPLTAEQVRDARLRVCSRLDSDAAREVLEALGIGAEVKVWVA